MATKSKKTAFPRAVYLVSSNGKNGSCLRNRADARANARMWNKQRAINGQAYLPPFVIEKYTRAVDADFRAAVAKALKRLEHNGGYDEFELKIKQLLKTP